MDGLKKVYEENNNNEHPNGSRVKLALDLEKIWQTVYFQLRVSVGYPLNIN